MSASGSMTAWRRVPPVIPVRWGLNKRAVWQGTQACVALGPNWAAHFGMHRAVPTTGRRPNSNRAPAPVTGSPAKYTKQAWPWAHGSPEVPGSPGAPVAPAASAAVDSIYAGMPEAGVSEAYRRSGRRCQPAGPQSASGPPAGQRFMLKLVQGVEEKNWARATCSAGFHGADRLQFHRACGDVPQQAEHLARQNT